MKPTFRKVYKTIGSGPSLVLPVITLPKMYIWQQAIFDAAMDSEFKVRVDFGRRSGKAYVEQAMETWRQTFHPPLPKSD